MTKIKLHHDFLGEFQETLKTKSDVTVSLQDGSVDISKMVFLLAADIWREMLRTLEHEEVTIIIPDHDLCTFSRITDVIITGKAKFQSDEYDQYLKTQEFALDVFGLGNDKLSSSGEIRRNKENDDNQITSSFLENLSPEQCKFCLKGFASKQSRKRHEAHCIAKENNWICDLCAKTFKTEQGLISHKLEHDSNYKFECNCCSVTYKSLSELRRHCKMLKHTYPVVEGPTLENDERCKICFKEVKKSNLALHLRKHDEEDNKMHKCDHCDYSTLRKNNLERHLEQKHYSFNINLDAIQEHFKTNDSLSCQKCGQSFTTPLEAKTHFLLKNCGNSDGLRCTTCDIKFKMKQNLKAHMKRKHPQMLH